MDENINTTVQETEPVSSAPVKKKRGKFKLIAILTIIVICLSAIGAYSYFYFKGVVNIYEFIPRTAKEMTFREEFEGLDYCIGMNTWSSVFFCNNYDNMNYNMMTIKIPNNEGGWNEDCINDILSNKKYQNTIKYFDYDTDKLSVAKKVEHNVKALEYANETLGFNRYITKRMLNTEDDNWEYEMKSKYATVKWSYSNTGGLEVSYYNK